MEDKPINQTNTCGTCMYWAIDPSEKGGECRIRAPATNGLNLGAMWPVTRSIDWCGEWDRPAPEPEPSVHGIYPVAEGGDQSYVHVYYGPDHKPHDGACKCDTCCALAELTMVAAGALRVIDHTSAAIKAQQHVGVMDEAHEAEAKKARQHAGVHHPGDTCFACGQTEWCADCKDALEAIRNAVEQKKPQQPVPHEHRWLPVSDGNEVRCIHCGETAFTPRIDPSQRTE